MPDEEIKAGDVVQLKSGGPNMTVSQTGTTQMTGDEPQAWCVWFDGKKKYEETFPLTALKKAPPPSAPYVGRAVVRG